MEYADVVRIMRDEIWRNNEQHFSEGECPECKTTTTMLKVVKWARGKDKDEFDVDVEEFAKCLICNNLFKKTLVKEV